MIIAADQYTWKKK